MVISCSERGTAPKMLSSVMCVESLGRVGRIRRHSSPVRKAPASESSRGEVADGRLMCQAAPYRSRRAGRFANYGPAGA
jgi:hypothetical protein